jgi:uncharacterized membrane protein YgcG
MSLRFHEAALWVIACVCLGVEFRIGGVFKGGFDRIRSWILFFFRYLAELNALAQRHPYLLNFPPCKWCLADLDFKEGDFKGSQTDRRHDCAVSLLACLKIGQEADNQKVDFGGFDKNTPKKLTGGGSSGGSSYGGGGTYSGGGFVLGTCEVALAAHRC